MWVGHTQRECITDFVPNKGTIWAVQAHARGWLRNALQSRKCVYPVGVTDEGLPVRVVSELAPITLEEEDSRVAFPGNMLAAHGFPFARLRY